MITLTEAKNIAGDIAEAELRKFCSFGKLLADEFLEEDGAWLFFGSESLNPPRGSMIWDAICVSKKGEVRLMGGWQPNDQGAKDWLKTMSAYFIENDL
jgi:hypothetical protein